MNVANLSAHQATYENLVGITGGSSCPEDRAALLVFPPAAVDMLAGHSFGEIRSGPSTSFEHNSMFLKEPYRIHKDRDARRRPSVLLCESPLYFVLLGIKRSIQTRSPHPRYGTLASRTTITLTF